jgi:hypothetical protein
MQIEARKQYEAKAAELAGLLASGKDGNHDRFTPWFTKCKLELLDAA